MYLDCVVPELCVREFSRRWLQHGDGGTVETTCFVEAMAVESQDGSTTASRWRGILKRFRNISTVYLWSCHVVLSHIYH